MKTILIVEDIELNIDLLTQLLEDDYNLLVAQRRRAGGGTCRTEQSGPGPDGYFAAGHGWL